MNVKKMFASLTGVLMLATMATPLVSGAATYSDELRMAYDYAYSKNITTMSSIDNANMYGELTRGQLAKMIANWAEKEMGTKVDETAVCSFADANTAEGDLAMYVKKACQMGLMGQNVEKFRPNDKVTRAEFGTTLSRALWGDKYNGGTPFYVNHLNALRDAKIMNKIDTPNQMEIRGFVMLMLKRSAEVVTPAECKDAAVILACALNSDTCPAACKGKTPEQTPDTATGSTIDGMTIAGDLAVAVADYSAEVKSAPATGTVIFNTVAFNASEKVTVESVKLERIGLSDKSAIKGVWFEKDGVAVSARASVTSDGTVTTRFYKNGNVFNGVEKLDLVVELGGQAGSEIAFKFVDVKSTARNSTFSAQTTKYRTTTYQVASLMFDAVVGANVEYKLGEKKEYEFGRFNISNETSSSEDKDVVLKSLKLRNAGNADLALVLKNVKVVRDGKVVSKKVELDSRDMVIYFEDTLASGKKGIYSIMAEIAQLDRLDDTVQFELRKNTELVGYEKNSNFRVAYKDSSRMKMKSYMIKGGKLVFITKSGFPKVIEAAASSTDVEIANGTFNVSEPVKLEGFRVKVTDKVVAENVIKNLKLEIGGSTYTSSDKTSNVGGVDVYTFTDDIFVSKTSDVKLLVNLKTTAPLASRVKFDNIKSSYFEKGLYENSDNTFTPSDEIAGVVNVSELVVKTPTFSITNKATGTAKVVKGNSDRVVIFDGEITTNKDKISVNELGLAGTFSLGALNPGEQIDLSLSVNGEPFSDATFRSAGVVFNNLGDVEKGKPMKIKVEAQPSIEREGHITFALSATGTDSQSNDTTANPTNALKLQIVGASELSISNSSATSTVEVASSNAQLLKFSTRVKNGAATLTGLVISGDAATSFDILGGKRVTAKLTNGTTFDSEAVVAGSGLVVFTGLNETLPEGNLDITFTVDVDADGQLTGALVNIRSVTMHYDGKSAVKDNLGVKYLFVKVMPKLALKSNSNNELVVEITNPSDSQHEFALTGYAVKSPTALPQTASLNGQNIAVATNANMTAITDNQVTLNPGESTTLRLSVADVVNHKSTQLAGIQIYFEDGSDKYTYDITDVYTNVATWADLKVDYKS